MDGAALPLADATPTPITAALLGGTATRANLGGRDAQRRDSLHAPTG
ncbi:hypothetical protein ACN27J_13855 [Solwaraspora sp. WMMB762]